ncbi:MAG: DNA polymerase domain-containing protein [Candidatus Heimdallarchaeota archaeon]
MKDIKTRILKLKEQIAETQKEADKFNALQLALKLVLNGTYGAFGNRHFIFSNPQIANAITSMGREIINYMDQCNEKYWYQIWHVDYELHKHLEIETPRQIINPDEPVSIYIDTDSLFVGFQPGLSSCNWQRDPMDFIHKVNNFRLLDFFKDCLIEYAKKYGVENIQDFELERVNESIIFLEKKRYVQNVVYEDGRDYERLSYIYAKGVELIKSSTPIFVREKMSYLMKYILDTRKQLSISELNKKIREMKHMFEMADIEDISSSIGLNNYEKWCINDQSKYEYELGTPFHVKASIFHNYLLNKHPEFKKQYNLLKSGLKIKYYYCKDRRNNVFAFDRGAYPKEFAPPIDIDIQFQKTILNIVNMFTNALGLPELNSRLTFRLSIF